MMFNKNKKGIGKVLNLILSLPIILLLGLMLTIGVFQLGTEYYLDTVHNVTLETAESFNISNSYVVTINNLRDKFDTQQPPFENLFAFILILVMSSSVVIAIFSEKMPVFSFLGSVLFGIMFMLFITTFIDQFATWYLEDFFYKVFDRVDNIVLDWYFDDLSLINTIWFGLLLFLNQIEINVSNLFGRKDEPFDGVIEE